MDLIRKNDAVPDKWKQREKGKEDCQREKNIHIMALCSASKQEERKVKFISCWSQICKRWFHRGVAQMFVHRRNRSLRRHRLAPRSFHRSLNTVLMHQCDVWSNSDTRYSDDRTSFLLDNVYEVWYRPVSHVRQECSNRSCREHLCSEWNKPMASSSGHWCWTLWKLEKRNFSRSGWNNRHLRQTTNWHDCDILKRCALGWEDTLESFLLTHRRPSLSRMRR